MSVLVFTTDAGVRTFYRMGIRLMYHHKYQSQDWDWFKAGAEKVCLGLSPAVWRQRKHKNIPAESTLHDSCWHFELFSACSRVQKVPVVFSEIKVESVPEALCSTSKRHSSSTAVVVLNLGAGCTQVGSWLVLGNSNTRLSGSSSSLYVHANWDRITLSLTWN